MHYISILFLFFFNAILYGQCEDFGFEIEVYHPTCNGFCDGDIDIYPSGGTPPYELVITNEEGDIYSDVGWPGEHLLCPGWYYYLIIDDAGCELSDSVYLEDPVALGFSVTTGDPSAPGVCDGFIHVEDVIGDYESLSYIYSPNPYDAVGNELNDICYGSYAVTVVNEKGCSFTQNVDLALYLTLNKQNLNESFTINYAQGWLSYHYEGQEKTELIIYTLTGQKVKGIRLIKGDNKVNVQLRNGTYIYQVQAENNKRIDGKFVVIN
jgi:hypothetical protein